MLHAPQLPSVGVPAPFQVGFLFRVPLKESIFRPQNMYTFVPPLVGSNSTRVLFSQSALRINILGLHFFQVGARYNSLCHLISRRHRYNSPGGSLKHSPASFVWFNWWGCRALLSSVYTIVYVGETHNPLTSLSKEIFTAHILKVEEMSQTIPLCVSGAHTSNVIVSVSVLN